MERVKSTVITGGSDAFRLHCIAFAVERPLPVREIGTRKCNVAAVRWPIQQLKQLKGGACSDDPGVMMRYCHDFSPHHTPPLWIASIH